MLLQLPADSDDLPDTSTPVQTFARPDNTGASSAPSTHRKYSHCLPRGMGQRKNRRPGFVSVRDTHSRGTSPHAHTAGMAVGIETIGTIAVADPEIDARPDPVALPRCPCVSTDDGVRRIPPAEDLPNSWRGKASWLAFTADPPIADCDRFRPRFVAGSPPTVSTSTRGATVRSGEERERKPILSPSALLTSSCLRDARHSRGACTPGRFVISPSRISPLL